MCLDCYFLAEGVHNVSVIFLAVCLIELPIFEFPSYLLSIIRFSNWIFNRKLNLCLRIYPENSFFLCSIIQLSLFCIIHSYLNKCVWNIRFIITLLLYNIRYKGCLDNIAFICKLMSICKIVRNLILVASLENPTCKDFALNRCRVATRNFYHSLRIYIIICFLRILCILGRIKLDFNISVWHVIRRTLECFRLIDILIYFNRKLYYLRPTVYCYQCLYLFLTAWLIPVILFLELVVQNSFEIVILFPITNLSVTKLNLCTIRQCLNFTVRRIYLDCIL